MATSGYDAFTEGLMGGMQFRRDSKRARRVDQLLDLEYEKGALAQWGQRGDVNAARAELGLDPVDFAAEGMDSTVDDDPYGGFGGKLRSLFSPKNLWANFKRNAGIGEGPPRPVAENEMAQQQNQQAIEGITSGADASSLAGGSFDYGTMQGAIMSADGGPVRKWKKYANGGAIPSIEDQLDEAGRRPPARPTPPSVESQLDSQLDERTRARMEARNNPSRTRRALDWGRRQAGRGARFARGASGVGGAIAGAQGAARGYQTETEQMRDEYTMPEALMVNEDDSNFDIFLKDLGARYLGVGNYVGEAALDLIGFGNDDDQAAAIRASDVAAQPTEREPVDIGELPTMTVRGNAGAAAPPERPTAIPERDDGPVQFADPNTAIIDPGEMPSMTTQEWAAYRATSVDRLVARGMTLPEAHDAVTTMQQKGFLNYGIQAFQLLQAGDPQRAAMALKAAYQYFPNGADVRFGIQRDAQGQPALVAMGSDEQTGESMGPPMLITAERLGVMMENMTNPDAFRTWTKDWREFEQDLREYYEVTKPEAESNARYRDRAGRAALMNAEANVVDANRTGSTLRQSDLDRAYGEMEDILADKGLFEKVPPQELNYLRQIAAIAYESDPGNYPATIGQIIEIYDSGGMAAVDQWIRGE